MALKGNQYEFPPFRDLPVGARQEWRNRKLALELLAKPHAAQ